MGTSNKINNSNKSNNPNKNFGKTSDIIKIFFICSFSRLMLILKLELPYELTEILNTLSFLSVMPLFLNFPQIMCHIFIVDFLLQGLY